MNAPAPLQLTWGLDCPGDSVSFIPPDVPAIWPYVTGSKAIVWTPEQIAAFPKAHVVRVNQGFNSWGDLDGDEFDIEEMAWNPDQVANVVAARRARNWSTRLYGTYDTYGQVTRLLADAGTRRSTWWRIADWDLSAHLAQQELWGDVYAGQYASPSSNPHTIIPGTAHDLMTANCDLNVLLLENTGWEG